MSDRKKLQKALENYRNAAQRTATKIEECMQIYAPEAASIESERLKSELEKEKQKALDVIRAERASAEKEADEWGRMDGSRITDDVKLLDSGIITADQFAQLAEKYQDNGTMCQALRKYAERHNEQLRAQSREAFPVGLIDLGQLPTMESRRAELTHDAKSAESILNMIDGGFLGGPGSAMVDAAIAGFGKE